MEIKKNLTQCPQGHFYDASAPTVAMLRHTATSPKPLHPVRLAAISVRPSLPALPELLPEISLRPLLPARQVATVVAMATPQCQFPCTMTMLLRLLQEIPLSPL